MKQNFRKGFTLVELVLVISIVVVLSVISGPIYRSYAYKARQAERYALLGTIRSAQENYYGEYGTFRVSSWTCNDEVLGIDARPNKYYTWFHTCASLEFGYSGPYEFYKYMCCPIVVGSGAANISMEYNRTSGVTMWSAGINAD